MISFIKKLFLKGPAVDYSLLVKNGALILDVRTPQEFKGGHIKGAVNIPLDQIGSGNAALADKKRVVITCCASGMRSAAAKRLLLSRGFTEVYNGGGWTSLNHKLNG